MANLNPWQLLAWIVGLELLSAPIIVFIINSATNGYFRAKGIHIGKIAKALAETIDKSIGKKKQAPEEENQ